MKRVLSLTTLYPNAAAPRFGTFVARSLEALAARGDWQVTVINPIGVPPVAFGRLIDRQGARVGVLPTGAGQKQLVVDDPPWIAVAEMLVRRL